MSGPTHTGSTRRAALAVAAPGDLLKSPSFWLGQKKLLAVLVLGAFIIVRLGPYTYQYADGWIIFTIGAQLLAVWGVVVAAKGLARLQVESAIVGEIEARGEEYLREVKAQSKGRLDLDKLEEDILPDNVSTPPPAMIRLFQHIFKEARDRKFESSVNVVQPYREEPLEDIFKLQNLQKIALWIGILGTFVGLLLAMSAEKFANLQGEEDFMRVIKEMFGNLFVSFSASLAGLEAAVILGFLVLILRKQQETYFQSMESAVVTMLSLARNAVNKDAYLAEFRQLRYTLEELSGRVFNQTEEYSAGLADLQEKIVSQTEQIRAGIEALATARKQFDGFLAQVGASQRELIDDVKGVYDSISLKNVGVTLQETIAAAGRHISDTLNPHVAQLSNQIAQFNGALDGLTGALQRQSAESSEAYRQAEGRAAANASALKEVGQQIRVGFDAARARDARNVTPDLSDLSQKLARLTATLERPGRISLLRRIRFRFRELLSNIW
ncbi:MAG: hypothetical protein ABW208_03795 [Pyrinomonadaceae bacterium]